MLASFFHQHFCQFTLWDRSLSACFLFDESAKNLLKNVRLDYFAAYTLRWCAVPAYWWCLCLGCAQSLSTFWGANGSPAKGAALPSVRIVYSSADKISKVVGERRDKGLSTGSTQGPRLVEVRLRLKAQVGDARNQILEALGRTPDLASPKHTPSKKLMDWISMEWFRKLPLDACEGSGDGMLSGHRGHAGPILDQYYGGNVERTVLQPLA
jgi:hypothetical protein